MKWFGGKAGREGARPALSRAGVASVGGWLQNGAQGYEAQVREGYGRNAVAQRAVKLVAEAIGNAALTASDPALVALVAARSGGQPLIETVAAQLLLHGNAYVQVLRDAGGGVAELFALRPERVAIEVDASGWPAAYRYTVGGTSIRFGADPVRPEIVHVKAFNPLDDHYGLGSLGAAAGAIGVHNAAAAWNKALLDNAARPSGALVYDPGDGSALSPDQFQRLRAEMEGAFAGAGNAGRPMLLEGGLRWQAMSLTPADMDFVGLKAAAAREIALAFGVPPMLLGQPGDATYANYREANKALWRLAVLPLAAMLLDGLSDGLKGWFEGAWLRIDLDRVPALAEDREALWASVSGADFLSNAEKRAMLGDRAGDGVVSAGEVLAQLLAQGAERGADLVTLRAIAEEAGELGATRALTRLGLADANASADVAELRELLQAWRDAKRSAWRAVVAWVVRIGGALLLAGLAVKLGFGEWVK